MSPVLSLIHLFIHHPLIHTLLPRANDCNSPFGDSHMNQICVSPSESSQSSERDNDLNVNTHIKRKLLISLLRK